MNKTYVTFDEIIKSLSTNHELISELNKFEKVIAVTRGGLVVAGILSQYLKTRWYDTVSLKSYESQEQKNIEVVKINPTDEEVLLVEDIVDTGDSLIELKKHFPNAKVFALHYKNEKSKAEPDFYLWKTNDWIVYPWEVEE